MSDKTKKFLIALVIALVSAATTYFTTHDSDKAVDAFQKGIPAAEQPVTP